MNVWRKYELLCVYQANEFLLLGERGTRTRQFRSGASFYFELPVQACRDDATRETRRKKKRMLGRRLPRFELNTLDVVCTVRRIAGFDVIVASCVH